MALIWVGWSQPSLADFSIYPQLVFRYSAGVDDMLPIDDSLPVRDWLLRMSQHLPTNPLLVPDFMLLHRPPFE